MGKNQQKNKVIPYYSKKDTGTDSIGKFGPYESRITKSYLTIRVINIGTGPIKRAEITPGRIEVGLHEDNDFVVEGTLNCNGIVSGMAKLLSRLKISENEILHFRIIRSEEGSRVIVYSSDKRGYTPKCIIDCDETDKRTLFEKKTVQSCTY